MFDGDGVRLNRIYSAMNEMIKANYGKGDTETAERILSFVKLDAKEREEFDSKYEKLMKDNEKCRKARGETRDEYRPIVCSTCFDIY